METLKQKLVLGLLGLLMVTKMNSQSLRIVGKVLDTEKNKISAQYVLKCDGQEIVNDNGSKLKVKLEPNKVYKLTFSKPGYASKTISFSTFTKNLQENFTFSFKVTLKKLPSELYVINDEKSVGDIYADVYYDNYLGTYNYKKHQ